MDTWTQLYVAAIAGLCSERMGTGIWSGDTETRAKYIAKAIEVADAAEKEMIGHLSVVRASACPDRVFHSEQATAEWAKRQIAIPLVGE